MKDRLWRYGNQIQARYDTPVLTLVVYLKRGRPGVNLESWESRLGPDFPAPRYVSFGLAGCPAAEYLDRPEPLAWALAALMDPGSSSRAELKMACLRRIAGLKGGSIRSYLSTAWKTIYNWICGRLRNSRHFAPEKRTRRFERWR
jgi:hypothetical protein